jgi:beta-mannosidase
VRTSAVRFASECLAFAVPSTTGGFVPQDNGSSWDFADVVDHYATALGRPRELVVGELMEHVFGDWRREASPNRGGLVLWLRDLQPGHGWGVLESDGTPKAAYANLQRILAPRAVWFTDEGLDGLALHAANDRPTPWAGTLQVALFHPAGTVLEELAVPLEVPPQGAWTADVEGLLGRFVDASYAFRFGEPQVGRVTAELAGATASWALS